MNRSKNFWFALAALALAPSSRADEILPTAPGTSWEFQVADSSAAGPPVVLNVVLAGNGTVDGREVFKLETRRGNTLEKTELVLMDEDGVVCLRRSFASGKTISYAPPQRLIPATLQVGLKWELDDEVAGTGMHQRFTVAAVEDVIVPAGTFHAFRFDCEESWPITITIRRWFVPGTGLVKDVTTTRGPTGRLLSRVTTALKKFSPAAAPLPNESPAAVPASVTPLPKITLAVAKEREGAPATEFSANAPTLSVRWLGENLPVGGSVRVAWIAEDVGDIVAPNFIVDETRTTILAVHAGAQFTLSRPKDGWAAGKYRVELYLDEKLMDSVRVKIVD